MVRFWQQENSLPKSHHTNISHLKHYNNAKNF